MDLFGRDMISALEHVSRRTPSEQFKTFIENLSSVLQSGQSLAPFLREQYERHQEEAAERQEDLLERLATVAEAYVTVFVAACSSDDDSPRVRPDDDGTPAVTDDGISRHPRQRRVLGSR